MSEVFWYSLIAGGAGTLTGGVLAMATPRRAVPYATAAAGGLMLAIVAFDLIPDSLAIANLGMLVSGLLAGLLIMEALRLVLDKDKNSVNIKVKGVLLLLAIALHNLPEGLAIGSSHAMGDGQTITLLIALHNVPEGLAVAAAMIDCGTSRAKAALLAGCSGLPTVLGAVAGYALSEVFSAWIALSLTLASGAMLYVVFCQLEHTDNLSPRNNGFAQIAGFIAGIAMINLLK